MDAINLNTIIGLMTALLVAYAAWRSHSNSASINAVHLAVNSRLDQLVEEIRKNALVNGIAEGRKQVHEERKKSVDN